MASAIFNVLRYIPASTAAKALGKVDKRFKTFFANAAAYGYDINNAVDFISKKFSTETEEEKLKRKPTPTPEENLAMQRMTSENVIPSLLKGGAALATGGLLAGGGEEEPQGETTAKQGTVRQAQQTPSDIFLQRAPRLGQFIEKRVNEGIDPVSAATQARSVRALQEEITAVELEAEQKLEDIVGHVFNWSAPKQQTAQGNMQAAPAESDWMSAQKELSSLLQQYNQSKGIR